MDGPAAVTTSAGIGRADARRGAASEAARARLPPPPLPEAALGLLVLLLLLEAHRRRRAQRHVRPARRHPRVLRELPVRRAHHLLRTSPR